MARASIRIFPKKIEYSDNQLRPEVPEEVFKVAQKIIEARDGCELVRVPNGLYIIMYSESGPSNQKTGWDGWLPVYVAQIEQWHSGGIKEIEMEEFLQEKTHENES